ncbi:MAG TPA: hypothetical protein VM677_17460 [Actinokineospora sp.]|nr:hypothetical protein [Actinokineospora sp.]
MTTKTLVRTSPLDWDKARAALRDRSGWRVQFGDRVVRVIAEPLLRRAEGGGLEQSIRFDADIVLTQAHVRAPAGVSLVAGTEPVGGGLRVFVPEVSEPTEVEVVLPEISAAAVAITLRPVRHWEVHLVHHSHLDIGYTDPQGRVVAEHLSYLDSALRLVKETDDWSDDARFRWTVESLWSFDQWADGRPAEVVADFVERVREGRIELTALPFNLNTEACSTDELHELLRIAKDVKARHGVPITTAMQTDVPGCVGGLVDVLAANGVRYLSVAHNWAGRSVPHLTGGQDVPRLFWWRSLGGERILVWVTDTPHGLAYMEGPMLGFDTSYESVEDLLPAYLQALATQPYPFDGTMFGFPAADTPLHREPYDGDILHLRVQGHFGDNAPPRRIMSQTVRQWNEKWAYPHLRLSTNHEFFVAAEQRLGDRVPEFTGDWNNWWADGVGSGARPVQLVRHAQGALADAQTISTVAGLLGADEAAKDTHDARAVYLDASLFDEHTWGAADPWTHGDDHHHSGDEQWHWKYHTATAAHDGARALKTTALSRLAQRLGLGTDALASLYVVNTAGVERGGVVRAFLPESMVPVETPLTARDARTKEILPLTESPQVNPTHREAGRFLHVAVAGVPPVGLVRVDLTAAAGPVPAPEVSTWGAPVLENDRMRVEVDLASASIGSIVAKDTGTELVRADASFGFNAYVYDEYGSAAGLNHQSGFLEAAPNLALLGKRSLARPAALVELGRDAVRRWLTYEAWCAGSRVLTTLSLEHDGDRLEITNRLHKAPTMAKESGYFAFPFAGDDPVVRYDTSASVAGTDLPQVPGGARHMVGIRHWVALHADGVAIAWTTQDVPLVEFGDIALPYAPFPPTAPAVEPSTVYSWAHNNLWDTNFPSQQGMEMSFRYSVSATAATSPEQACAVAAARALAHSQPLAHAFGTEHGRVREPELQFVTLSDDRVRLVGLTTPEPGSVLVRLQSVADTTVRCAVRLAGPVLSAELANYLGDPAGYAEFVEGTAHVTVPAHSTAACLFRLAGPNRAPIT